MWRIALKTAGIVFLAVSAMHLLRLSLRVKITVGSFSVPLWYSLVGFAAALSLSLFMFSAAR